MKKERRISGKATAWMVVIAIILGITSFLPMSVAAQSAVVSIPDASAKSGETVQVHINITNVTDLGAVKIELSYNNSVVIVDDVTAGTMGSITKAINNDAGVTTMNWFSAEGVAGDYVFAYVTLNATGSADDTSELNLTVKKLVDTSNNPIEYAEDDGVFTVEIGPAPLVAEAGGPYSGLVDQPITLTGSATGGTSPYSYAWDLDNDSIYDDATGATVSHTWSTADTYTVGLQVTDSATPANVSTDTATVVVSEVVGALVSIPDASADTGETVTMPINITNVTNLGAVKIELSYNNSVVIVDDVTAGTMGSITKAINNDAGVTTMNWFSAEGVTGNYVFAYVTLNATGSADDTSELNITVKKLVDISNNPIEYTEDDGVFTVGVPGPTLTWVTEPPASVTQGDDVTFRVSFSEAADYYFRIENSTGGVVWRYPTLGTNSAMNPLAKTWTTTTDTPTGDYTIIININDVDKVGADTRTVTVQALVEQVPISNVEGGSDPDITLSSTGNIYVAYWGYATEYGGIDFTKSTDGGVSFSDQIIAGGAAAGAEDAAIAAYGENNVYVVWTEDGKIYYARSTNGGDSFETKVQVSDAAGCDGDPDIAVDSSGVIYVVWDGGDYIYVDKSTDGTAFGTDVIVDNDASPMRSAPSIAIDSDDNIHVAGHRGHVYYVKSTDGGATFTTHVQVDDSDVEAYWPSIVVDPADSNKIYVAWKDVRDGSGDIYAAASDNGGATFGAGVKVNDDTTDTEQKYPCMAVNSSGAVFVVWQDGRNYEYDSDIYFAGSTDGGSTFSENRKVNPDETKAKTPTLTVDDTDAFVAWKNTDADDGKIYFRKMPLEEEVPTPVLTTITVSPETAEVAVDGTQLFTATAKDQNSEVMAGIVITWTSSDETVGTVNPLIATTVADGTATTTFTALAEGTTTVMAASGDVSKTAVVNVSEVTCGDVAPYPDGNGEVDMGDVVLLLNHVGNSAGYPVNEWAGDVKCTGDGEINMGDVVLLLNHVSDQVAFPLECC